MKRTTIIEAVAVILVVLLVLAGKWYFGARSEPEKTVSSPASTQQEDAEMGESMPSADDIMALVAVDNAKADELAGKMCTLWLSALKYEPDIKSAIALVAEVYGMDPNEPEILKTTPVRKCLFEKVRPLYAESGLDPKAEKALLFGALDVLVNDLREQKAGSPKNETEPPAKP
jgi:hypothetical protein